VTEPAAPTGDPNATQWMPEPPAPPAKTPRWSKWLFGVGVVLIVVLLLGSVIRVPYDTLAPGGTLDLSSRVSISGTKDYPDRSDLMMLFVRERAHVNLWSLLQAKLDGDIDLVKQKDITGDRSQHEVDLEDVCAMSQSQDDARVAALRALGYKVPTQPGLQTVSLPHGFSTPANANATGKTDTTTKTDTTVTHPLYAWKSLQPCDQILSADGQKLKQPDDLSKIIKAKAPGSSVELGVSRGGKPLTVESRVVQGPEGTPIIGVNLGLRYKFPVDINIDTNNISGPSAGLAITLAIIDALTPGELTGGKRVAITGTIDPDGNVGEIGGLPQKALAARNSHAQILIVPHCGDDPCRKDVATARKRVGKDIAVHEVSTLAEALSVLRAAGGAPVPTHVTA
jgi:PDZ domain-containing protein